MVPASTQIKMTTMIAGMHNFVPSVGSITTFDPEMGQLEWRPDGGDKAYSEPLGEWLQPGTDRCKLLALLLLANRVPDAMIEHLEELNPYVYMGTFSDLRGTLTEEQEKAIVKQVTKKEGLINEIPRLGTALETMMEVVRSKERVLYHMWEKKELQTGEGAHTWRKVYKELVTEIVPDTVMEVQSGSEPENEAPRARAPQQLGATQQNPLDKLQNLSEREEMEVAKGWVRRFAPSSGRQQEHQCARQTRGKASSHRSQGSQVMNSGWTSLSKSWGT